MRVYNYENCYALEFMRQKFHDLSEKLEFKIARRAYNPNVHKQNFQKFQLVWKTLKMKMKKNLVCFTCKRVLFEKWQFSAQTQIDS